MNKKLVLISLVMAFLFVAAYASAQTLPEGYDSYTDDLTTISTNETAGTTFVQDLEEIRRRRIDEVIQKIKAGDPNILRFVVYDVFEEVHKEIIRKGRVEKKSYYEIVGMENAIPAYIGGFDNQDPRVRLRCIGWLGDWVDEIGKNMTDIKKRTMDRIVSRIETREEVKYGLRLLYLKIARKEVLNKIYEGDIEVLANISADDFVPLVHDETFIRQIYCVPRRVQLRSIRLAPWWIDVEVLRSIVYYRLKFTEAKLTGKFVDIYGNLQQYQPQEISQSVLTQDMINRDSEETEKLKDPYLKYPDPNAPNDYDRGGYIITSRTEMQLRDTKFAADGKRFEILGTYLASTATGDTNSYNNFVGYVDMEGKWDIQSLYDIRYFNYSEDGKAFKRPDAAGKLQQGPVQFDEGKIMRALLNGLRNRHLVVRENVARVIIMLTDPYIIFDVAGRVIGVKGVLSEIAKEASYREMVINAFKEVRYAQFIDVARPSSNVKRNADDNKLFDSITYYDIDGIMIDYPGSGRTYPIGNGLNPWDYKWTYRIDIHELLRRMGLGAFLVCEQEEQIKKVVVDTTDTISYFVESLFDLSTLDVAKTLDKNNPFYYIPNWHGVDVIDSEIYNQGPGF